MNAVKNFKHPLLFGLAHFARYASTRVIVLIGLMICQRATAGLGILLILPVMSVLGFELDGRHVISNHLYSVMTITGIPISLESLLVVFLGVIAIVTAIQYKTSTLSTRLQQGYTHALRMQVYGLIVNASWPLIASRKSSDFQHSISVLVQSAGHAIHLLLSLATALITLAVSLAISFVLSWQMTMLALATGLVAIICLWPLFKLSMQSGKQQLYSHKAIFHQVETQLANIKMIKSHAAEDRYAQIIENESDALEKQYLTMMKITARTKAVYAVTGALAASILFWLSQTWLLIPAPTLVVLVLIYSRLLPLFGQMQTNVQQLMQKSASYDSLIELISACGSAQQPRTQMQTPVLFREKICFSEVTFGYGQKTVIRNLTWVLYKGQLVLIRGQSGVGKSTLVDMLVGLVKPQIGQLLIDDEPLTEAKLLSWRSQVAYVTQDSYFFNDTIRNNLCALSSNNVSDEELWIALEIAAAKKFVEALPLKLDSRMGDRGVKLSGGEKQRIALARAIIRKPELLILDEATSALDEENERYIHEAISNLKEAMTIVVISHRTTHAFTPDQVIEL